MDISDQAVAALLAKEAAQLRQAAGFEGYSAFLQKPAVRARPNKQFLAATVRSVESANRMAQVSEMWQARQKELSEEEGSAGKPSGSRTFQPRKASDAGSGEPSQRGAPSRLRSARDIEADASRKSAERGTLGEQRRHSGVPAERRLEDDRFLEDDSDMSSSSGERTHNPSLQKMRQSRYARAEDDADLIGPQAQGSDEGDQDLELDKFLHSKKKRGRGAVGSRMDEPGPFAVPLDGEELEERGTSAKAAVILGPQLPAELEDKRRQEKRSELLNTSDGSSGQHKLKRKHRTDEEKRARKEQKRRRRLEKERVREEKRRKKAHD